jgi:glycosyltransferase involved in cell wall biosynthesis
VIPDPASGRLTGSAVRIVRIIARLNIGGPSIQAITLTDRLTDLGYATTLVHGREGEREGNMHHLADELGVTPVVIDELRRDPSLHDLAALLALIRVIRRARPALVHTHAAKAGTLGRVAAIIASVGRRRPVLVHTYHGHSLSGYFSPRVTEVYRRIERFLARRTDRLIAVSEEVRDDLVALGVATRERFEVVPLGFELARFTVEGPVREQAGRALRAELDVPADVPVVTLVARLAPIKRVDRFLGAARRLLDVPDVRFLIVGDGELHDELRRSPDASALEGRLTWTGFRRDIPAVCFASDVVVLCSDNEGTPVSLIEAAAAGVPTVSARVGGAATVVLDGETGILSADNGEEALSAAIRSLLEDPQLRARMGAAARVHALSAFSIDRLITDLDGLYRRLLAQAR